MAANGYHAPEVVRPLKAGIYAPIPSFFLPETEDLGMSASCNIFVPNFC
jgi:4-hydroxy-2-oxoglutarate aldolase